ncbi:Kef-type K+ transport system membrane component KefB [Lysobacter niastensis]|uniref:Kef-type K+ transport system membrane component KefB n=1 Tax=Lysobacter niastensis TaxID=380629 RepID=A0ABU1W608_9GAMM|nr:cation:proton antiporter [Lysobacter niastensis]MDR7133028.1 Kef-type K+ transport system membrane component KefB [Lysobacter niastensis]
MHSPLLLQLVVILVAARLCGVLLRRFGQPPVIGEMAAGIVLGPIVFGAAFPEAHAALFPESSLGALTSLSTLGLVLFMFVVGAELRTPDGVRAQLRAAGWVSTLSVLLPFGASLALAPWLYPGLAPAGVGFWPFALFLATAMSITAFPVMARILKDRDMTRSRVGQLALGSAAIADVATWILLALVVALVGTGDGTAGYQPAAFLKATLGLLALAALVFGLLKPVYAWLLRTHAQDGEPSAMVLAALLVGMLACAALTEWLELHAVFGAFLFGACLPRDDRLLHALTARLEHIAVVLLMPIFFALAGLKTTGDAFSGAGLAALALILVTAVAGKIVGGAAGARLAGNGWRDSLATGALMNARGLMELIVLKVGLDAGLIGPQLFTMLLAMAILTTVMTGPLLGLFVGRSQAGEAGLARSRA